MVVYRFYVDYAKMIALEMSTTTWRKVCEAEAPTYKRYAAVIARIYVPTFSAEVGLLLILRMFFERWISVSPP